jgi:hypothetical protein
MEDETKDKEYNRAKVIPLSLDDLDKLVYQALSSIHIQVFYPFDRIVNPSNQITYKIRSNSISNNIDEIRLFVLNGKTIFYYPPRQDVALPNDLFDGSYSFEEGREDGKKVLRISGPGYERLNDEHFQFIFLFMDEIRKLTGQLIFEDSDDQEKDSQNPDDISTNQSVVRPNIPKTFLRNSRS